MRTQQGLFGILAIVVVLALAACSGSDGVISGSSNTSGTNVRFVIGADVSVAASTLEGGDDDRPKLQSANVTFSSILARNLDGQLIDVDIALPATVDLLQVLNGRSAELPMGSLPMGTYDQLVVVMTAVQLVTQDGTTIDITPPGGGFTAVINVCPFETVDGEVTTVRLRFRGDSFRYRSHEEGYGFDPAFACETD